MTLASTLALAVALFVLASTPGPGVMTVVACAMGRGLAPALAMAAGIVAGDLVFLLFAAFGLALLAEVLGGLFLLIKIAGAAYLIWLGVKMFRAKPVVPEPAAVAPRGSVARSAVAGFVLTLGNPKVILFYVGFLPTFVDLQTLTALDLAVIAATVVVVIGGTLASYAGLAGQARRLLVSERRVRWLNRCAGSIMIGSGVAIATR